MTGAPHLLFAPRGGCEAVGEALRTLVVTGGLTLAGQSGALLTIRSSAGR